MYTLLSMEEAARQIGWSYDRMKKTVQRGLGPRVIRTGRRIDIAEDELWKWMKDKREHSEREENVTKEMLQKGIVGIEEKEEIITEEVRSKIEKVKQEFAYLIPIGEKAREEIAVFEERYGKEVRALKDRLDGYDFKKLKGTDNPVIKLHRYLGHMIGHLDITWKISGAVVALQTLNERSIHNQDHERAKVQILGTQHMEKDLTETISTIGYIMRAMETSGGLDARLEGVAPSPHHRSLTHGLPSTRKRQIETPE